MIFRGIFIMSNKVKQDPQKGWNESLIYSENPLGTFEKNIDGRGKVNLVELDVSLYQIKKYMLKPESPYVSWRLDDERKQLEQASFARSALLFSAFAAYCIILTLLYAKIGTSENSIFYDFNFIIHLAFMAMFYSFGAMLKRTNDKARIVFQLLASVKSHNYSIVHQLYLRRGEQFKALRSLFFKITRSEPFWVQNIVAFVPFALAVTFFGISLFQCTN
jgi:hypothetical protein